MTRLMAGLKPGLDNYPKRGEIWYVSLEPAVGHEISKTRPALIISNDKNNEYSSTITLIPITSSIDKIFPFEVFISKEHSGLSMNSKIKCNQVRTIDKLRLLKLIGKISEETLSEVEEALLIHLGIKEGI